MLFISDFKKITTVIKMLQPILKFRVNIERDFDCGLNDVFEKRPAVVFIQNQIAGVTGESVARHIQLLLGADAPKFILIHDGDAAAKPIKGLYEQLIDLSQQELTVTADILEKLNLLLGPQWQKLFITSKLQGAADEAFVPASEADSGTFSQSLHDFIPEIEPIEVAATSMVQPLSLMSEAVAEETFPIISSTEDQLAEIISEEHREHESKEAAIAVVSEVRAGANVAPPDAVISSNGNGLAVLLPEISKPVGCEATIGTEKPVTQTEDTQASARAALQVQSLFAPPVVAEKVSPLEPAGSVGVLEGEPLIAAHEEMQWVFDGEPNLKKSTWKWYQVLELLLVLSLLVGVWYFIKQKPQPARSVVNEVNPSVAMKPVPGGQKSSAAAQQPEMAPLPPFIPVGGLDPAFAAENPGWERYVGKLVEYRLFRSHGKLKAVQVKAVKVHAIGEPMLKTILVAFTGGGEYRVTSEEQKHGFQVSHATVNSKTELLIYRKKSEIHAVVIALD